MTDAELIRELTRVKVVFQLRALCTALGIAQTETDTQTPEKPLSKASNP